MELAQLKNRILILKSTDTINENGFTVHNYEEIKELWAKVEQLKINEKVSAGKEAIRDTKRFIIRNYKEITEFNPNDLYIKYQDKIFDVKGYESFISDDNFISVVAEVLNGDQSNK